MQLFIVFASVAAFFFLAERIWPRRHQRILRRGVIADAIYIPLHFALRVVVSFTAAALLTELGRRIAPEQVDVLAGRPIWLQAAVVVVVLDFFFYVMHVAKHRWTWWWRLHETHHSSEELDFMAAARFHLLEKLLDRLVFLLPLTVLGADEPALLVWSTIDVFFGMLNHSNVRWRLGRPLIYVFNGPEMHLWHHAADPARRDCNFGNNLSVFDWIFRTAYVPDDRPTAFGIDDGVSYPQGNVVKQFFFAFRPVAKPSPNQLERQTSAILETSSADSSGYIGSDRT
jgi:sterol desaturase/sphingolipid hydroxylase (fatty acid hydroxylase superfamily)